MAGIGDELLGFLVDTSAGEEADAQRNLATAQFANGGAPITVNRNAHRPSPVVRKRTVTAAYANGRDNIGNKIADVPSSDADLPTVELPAVDVSAPSFDVPAVDNGFGAINEAMPFDPGFTPEQIPQAWDNMANALNRKITGPSVLERLQNGNPPTRDMYGDAHDLSAPQVTNTAPVSSPDDPADIPEKYVIRQILGNTVMPFLGGYRWLAENTPLGALYGDAPAEIGRAVQDWQNHPADFETDWGRDVGRHIASIGSSLAQMALAGMTKYPLTAIGAMSGGSEYFDQRERGVDPFTATIAAGLNGATEFGFEKLSGFGEGANAMKELFSAIGKGSFKDAAGRAGRALTNMALREEPSELATTLIQSLISTATDPTHTPSNIAPQMVDTFWDTAGMGIGLGGVGGTLNTAAKVMENRQDARRQSAISNMQDRLNGLGFPTSPAEAIDVVNALSRPNIAPMEQAARENPTANAAETGRRALDISKQRKREDATVRRVNERANANVLNTGNLSAANNVVDTQLLDKNGDSALLDYINAVKNARIHTAPTGGGEGPELKAEENSASPEIPSGVVKIDGRAMNVPGRKGVTVEHINERTKDNPALQATNVVQRIEDLPAEGQADIHEELKAQGMEGRTDLVEGYRSKRTGEAYLIGDNLKPERVEEVARHETIGHYGLQGMMEDTEQGSYDKLMNDISNSIESNKVLQQLRDEVMKSQPDITGYQLAEEIAAKMAERNMHNSFTQRIFGAIRRFLHKAGLIKGNVTDAQLSKYLRDSQKWLANGNGIRGAQFQGMMSNKATAGAFSNPNGNMSVGFHELSQDVREESQDAGKYESNIDDIFAGRKPAHDIKKWQDSVESGDMKYEIRALSLMDSDERAEYLKEQKKNLKRSLVGHDLFTKAQNKTDLMDKLSDDQIYQHLAGEVQARNVQNRLNMTPEERRNSLAESTEDVARKDQILITQGMEAMDSVNQSRTENDSESGNEKNSDENSQQRGGFDVPDITVADNIIRAFQDQDVDIKRVEDAILKTGGAITDESDVYLNKTLYISKVADRLERMNKEFTDPILTLVNESGVSYNEASDWLYARHVFLDDVNQQLADINENANADDALSGMSDGDAENIYKKHSGNKKLQEMAKLVDKLMQRNVRILVNSGLLTLEEATAWSNKYEHYVPLKRDNLSIRSETAWERVKKWWKARGNAFKVKAEKNGPTGGMPKAGGVETRGKESKRRMGSERRATNILGNVFASATAGIMRSQKQEVAHAVLKLAQDNPNPDFWTVDKKELVKRVNPQTGLVEMTYRDPDTRPKDNIFVVKVDGIEHWVKFNENDARAMEMCKALKAADAPQLMWITQAIGQLTRWTGGWLTTHNPVFALFNFMRDQQHMMFNLEDTPLKGKQLQVFKNLPGAMKGVWEVTRGERVNSKWAKYFDEFKRNGGETGFINNFANINDRVTDLKKRQKELARGKLNPRKWWSSFMDLIDDYNGITENGTRLAVYITSRENGLSGKQAARIAKEITVDFNRKGQRSSALNAIYMFTNANIQGHARMFRAIKNSARARWIAMSMVALGAGLSYAARAMMGKDPDTDKDKYDEISDFEKTTNWIFPTDTEGNYVKIPIAQGLHLLPSIGRIAVDTILNLANDKSSDAKHKVIHIIGRLMSLASVTADAFNPLGSAGSLPQLATPSVLRPAMQVYENKTFTGGLLHKNDAAYNGYNAPAYKKAFKRTPDHWVTLSKLLNDFTGGDDVKPGKLNVAPETLRLLFSSVFMPGMSTNIDRALGTFEKGKEWKTEDVPILNRLHGTAPNERMKEQKTYELMDNWKQTIEQMKRYRKQAKQLYQKNPDDPRIKELKQKYIDTRTELGDGNEDRGKARFKLFNMFNKDMIKINNRIREAKRGHNEEEVKRLEDLRSNLLQRFQHKENELFDKAALGN